MTDPELQTFCEDHPCIALEIHELVDRNIGELKAFLDAHSDIPRDLASLMPLTWIKHMESGGYSRQLLSFGKIWRARRNCDGCQAAMSAGDVRHLFRHVGDLKFDSFFICADCDAEEVTP